MKTKVFEREDEFTFLDSDFPNMATHCDQSEFGFSIYRGVLVQWDKDHDRRILNGSAAQIPRGLAQMMTARDALDTMRQIESIKPVNPKLARTLAALRAELGAM